MSGSATGHVEVKHDTVSVKQGKYNMFNIILL